MSSQNFQQILPLTKATSMRKANVNLLPNFGCFETVTSWNWQVATKCAHSLQWHRRGAFLFFNVIGQISMSFRPNKLTTLTQIGCFRILTPVWIQWWQRNDAYKLTRPKRCPIVLLCYLPDCKVTRAKIPTIWTRFEYFLDDNSNLNSRMAIKWHT